MHNHVKLDEANEYSNITWYDDAFELEKKLKGSEVDRFASTFIAHCELDLRYM